MEAKTCSMCKETKPFSEYHLCKSRNYRPNPYCKECSRTYRRERYARNKRVMRLQQKEMYSGPEGRLRYLINRSRSRAKEEGIEHTITVEDLHMPEVCPYLKIPFTLEWGKGQLRTNASIDRIDPSKGYIPGNVQIISRAANTMKSDASEEELVQFAKSVLRLHGKKKRRLLRLKGS